MRSLFLFVFICTGEFAFGDTVYIKPGQCIIVGGSQVCAETQGSSTSDQTCVGNKVLDTTYSCVYGVHKGAEVSEVKTYALFKTMTRCLGNKDELLIKSFGPNDKEKCESEAEARSKSK